jgi:hypothetical protein
MSELKTTVLKVTSRASVKIGDSFFTFEAGIEKSVPDDFDPALIPEEKKKMWDEMNTDIDNQIIEIQEFLRSKRK